MPKSNFSLGKNLAQFRKIPIKGSLDHIDAFLHKYLGITGDGRCLFRSVVYGASLRAGKACPSEKIQRELADELREKVVDEFIKRRADTEWFLEGDFDDYVLRMRQPHIWGGEPELLMSSHVLQMPITVYMSEKNSNDLKVIAEYGQEYGKEDPICVVYHGYGHYDALQNPASTKQSKSHNLALIGFYQDVDKDRALIVFLCLLAGASKDDPS